MHGDVLAVGCLGRGDEQFEPVRKLFPGTVWAYHTEGRDFPSGAPDPPRGQGHGYRRQGRQKLVLVGASMGGMLVPFIVAGIPRHGAELRHEASAGDSG